MLPGLINMHGHLHDERGGVPMDPHYVLKLWLACGVTTVRDVGSPLTRTNRPGQKETPGRSQPPACSFIRCLGASVIPKPPGAVSAKSRAPAPTA